MNYKVTKLPTSGTSFGNHYPYGTSGLPPTQMKKFVMPTSSNYSSLPKQSSQIASLNPSGGSQRQAATANAASGTGANR